MNSEVSMPCQSCLDYIEEIPMQQLFCPFSKAFKTYCVLSFVLLGTAGTKVKERVPALVRDLTVHSIRTNNFDNSVSEGCPAFWHLWATLKELFWATHSIHCDM